MNKIDRQQEYLRGMKCVHYFLSGQIIKAKMEKKIDFAKVLEQVEEYILIDRLNVAGSFSGTNTKENISLPVNIEDCFESGVERATQKIKEHYLIIHYADVQTRNDFISCVDQNSERLIFKEKKKGDLRSITHD